MARLLTRLLFLLLAAAAIDGMADDDLAQIKEQELEAVRERISDLKESMDRNARDRDRLATELQAAEVEIADKRARLAELEREHAFAERRRDELQADIAQREAELGDETAELAAQVRTAYMSGRQERLRLLLNQQDPATLGRMMAYYDYLNRHRAGNIDAVSERLRELGSLFSAVAAEEARLAGVAETRRREVEALATAQEERRGLIAGLRERLAGEEREVERLAAQEADLQRLIDELTTILSDYPIRSETPFSSHKGQLTWPVAGSLVHDFGQPRVDGRLKWNGVVLAAPRGREVRAVYHGRVAFADWLDGMGLLVIVDHGEGYLTLYGYNETLLTSPGDWVAPGDAIATVGDSGGQAQAGLYFELRRGTRPLNPREWVTRRPGR